MENLLAHINLDKKTLDQCETMDSMVDPEMSFGFSMSGADFPIFRRGTKKRGKRKKKKAYDEEFVDELMASADAVTFKNADIKLNDQKVDFSKTHKLEINPDLS